MSERRGCKSTTKKKADVSASADDTSRVLAMDLALSRLSKPSAAPPMPTTHHGVGRRRLPPLLTASRSEDREAALASLLLETLRCGHSSTAAAVDVSPSDGVLDLSGCGIVISDFPRIIDVLSLCPHIHTLDVRANAVDAPFLSKLVDLARGNQRLCEVLVDTQEQQHLQPTSSCTSADGSFVSANKCDQYIATLAEICVHNRAACEAARQRESLANKERLAQDRYAALLAHLSALSTMESTVREAIERQCDTVRVSMGKEHKSCLLRLASSLRRKLQLVTYQRQLESIVLREAEVRNSIVSSAQQELSLLLQADCGFHRRFLAMDEASVRQERKKEETASWVLARRAEKHRFGCERAAREALFEEESNARVVVVGEWDHNIASMTQARDASASQAKSCEDARLERARREEQMRKRLEDQARERAEKEEAQRQKALREFLLKQQQAREKLETDAGIVRKSLRSLEAALIGCLLRVSAAWFAFLQARLDAERATSTYCKLLIEPPVAKLHMPYQYMSADRFVPHLFVAEDASEWLQVLSPSNFHASHLNPHRKDHHLVPRISLKMASESRVATSVDSIATPPPGSPLLSSPTYADIPPASSPLASPSNGTATAALFQVGMRDAWLNAVKAAQYEFRTRVSKLESVKQSGRGKVAEELKMVRSAINQHRVEYARWRWQLAGQSSTAPLASPSASGASKVLVPPTASTVAPATDPFVPPEPLADPLAEQPSVDTAAGIQLNSALDMYVNAIAGFGKHQAFIASVIPLQLEEEDVRSNQTMGGSEQQPAATKELPAATLRVLKEQIQCCSVGCAVVNGTPKDYLRFEMPAANDAEAGGCWTSSVPQPSKRFENNFLHSRVSGFRNAATGHQQHPHPLHASPPHPPLHADAASVAAAVARQKRVELEAGAEAAKDPAAATAGEEIDYAALHLAKLQHEYLSSETFRRALCTSVEPLNEARQCELPRPELVELLLRDLAATCEYSQCNDVELTYVAPPSLSGTPRPSIPDPVDGGAAIPDPEAAAASPDGTVGISQAPPAETQVPTSAVSRNPAIIEDVTQFCSSIEYYTTCDAAEGVRWVQLSIVFRTAIDVSLHTNAFHVWRRLVRNQQTLASMDSVVEREERLIGMIPILVLRPRIPRTLFVPQCRVVVTRADQISLTASVGSSGFVGKPLHLLVSKDTELLALNIESSRAATLHPTAHPFNFDLGPPMGLVGSEFHVVLNTLAGSKPAAAPDIQLCFSSDSRLWMCVVDQISLKRSERSPLGTIFFSATGDGQQGVAIMEVVAGSLQPCGAAPLSSSPAVIQAAKRLSRKVSNAALNSGRRASAPNTSRSDTTSKNTVVLRVESSLVSSQVAADCLQRLCVAAAAGNGAPLGNSTASKSSVPSTPRCGSSVTDSHRCVAMTSRVDVFLRASQGARDGDSVSVPSTPREDLSLTALANHAVLNHRVMRTDVPLVSMHVESLPFAPAPHQQYFDANARSSLSPMSLPCGAYLLRGTEFPPVYLDPATGDMRSKIIAPFQFCALRVVMPDESNALDPAVRWTMVIASSNGDDDRVMNGATPMGTSRTETPVAANDQTHENLSRPSGTSGDDLASNEMAVVTAFTTRILPTSLLQCTGEEDHIHFVSVSSRTMGALLGCPPSQDGELTDEHDDVLIPVATIKTEDAAFVVVEANFKPLCEWLGAQDRVSQDRVSSRYLLPFFLEAILKLITLEVRLISHDAAVQLVPRLAHFDVELKFHVEEEQKPMKASKRSKSVVEPPSHLSFTLLPRVHASSVAILPASLGDEHSASTTVAAGQFGGPTDAPQRCGILCAGALFAASQRTEGGHFGVARLRASNHCANILKKWFLSPRVFSPPLPLGDSNVCMESEEWLSVGDSSCRLL